MNKIKFCIILVLISTLNLFSETNTTNITNENLKFWEKTFKYGTTSQKISILATFKGKKTKEVLPLILEYFPREKNLKVKKEMLSAVIAISNDAAKLLLDELLKNENYSDEMTEFLIGAVSLCKYNKAGKYILKYLDSENFLIKEATLRALGEIEYKEAIPIIISKFSNEKNERIRTAIILATANIKSPDAEDFLISIFTNKNEKILNRGFAATGLGYIKTEKAYNILIQNYENSEPEIKVRIIEALGNIANKQSLPFLIDCLKDDNPDIRYFAINALEKMNEKSVIEILEYKKDYDPEFKVRKAAEKILNTIKEEKNDI